MEEIEQVPSKAVKIQLDENNEKRGTFSFIGEDHTLGNLLRSVIIKKYFFIRSIFL